MKKHIIIVFSGTYAALNRMHKYSSVFCELLWTFLFHKYAILKESLIMSDFCCRVFEFPAPPDLADLYGAICAAIPPCYVCGQGFSNECLRFGLESGGKAELRFQGSTCEIWLLDCPREQTVEAAGTYGALFEELVRRLAVDGKERLHGRR